MTSADQSSDEPIPEPSRSSSTATDHKLTSDPTGVEPLPDSQPTRSDLYERRLQRIWTDTHGRALDMGNPLHATSWELVTRAVRDADFLNELQRVYLQRFTAASAQEEELFTGDASTVNLTLAGFIDQLGPAELQSLIRSELAEAVRRLETEGASREDVSDILVRALRPVAGAAEVSTIAGRLLGYLMGQQQRSSGYFLTVDMTGDILIRDDADEAHLTAIIAYCMVVQGMWQLVQQPSEDFGGANRRVPATTLSSMAREVARFDGSGAAATARDLLRLSAITAEPATGDLDKAAAVLSALGLDTTRTADLLAVVNVVGRSGSTWGTTDMARSALEAYGGVVAPLVNDPELAPARLFNAGVTALRSGIRSSSNAHGRTVLNLVGLLWAVDQVESLPVLETIGGYSCAVNFVGAASDLHEFDRGMARWPALLPVVQAVAGLSLVVEGADVNQGRARISASARTIGLGALVAPDPAMFRGMLVDGLATLTDPPLADRWHASERPDELVELTGEAVGWVYRTLFDAPLDNVTAEIGALVVARDQAERAFVDGYRAYATGPPDVPGRGPLVVAGVREQSEWQEQVASYLSVVPSIVPAMRNFTLANPTASARRGSARFRRGG